MKYKFVKGPTSDVKFEAYGKDMNELFENAALALSSVMCDVKKVRPRNSVKVFVDGKNAQDLLFNWLGEVIALVDIENMFFSGFRVRIHGNSLTAECMGEDANPKNSLTVVKSATYHDFRLEGDDKNGYKATVVLDI